jgi:diol dehydratase reactivase alpha subunit
MQRLASKIEDEILVSCAVGGVEAEMAVRGALTTPGTSPPLAILDLGGGSTDAALISEDGMIQSIHLAGAGEMVTLLIDTELGLEDKELSEDIKRYPLARVESLLHIRHEDGSVQFFEKALDPYGVVTGRANVRGIEGPRNAVATGLILAHEEKGAA